MGRQSRRRRNRRGDQGARPRAGNRPAPIEQAGNPMWAVVGLALLVAALVGVAAFVLVDVGRSAFSLGPTSNAPLVRQGRTIDGIPCNTSEQLTYHEHAHLTILVSGQAVTVPAGIGIDDNTCLYWLHTHDDSGVIHLEAPRPQSFTLGTFFDIWGQHLTSRDIAGSVVARGQALRVFVNGHRYTGNPRSVTLHRHTDITVEVGPPFVQPTPYTFGSGL